MRGFCVLWIICIWHLMDYYMALPLRNYIYNTYGVKITQIVLASFTFLSGLFLGRYTINNLKDCYHFYKKRFLRFYLLFFIASILLYFTPCEWGAFYKSPLQLFFSLVGVSAFWDGMPSTMWYMSMLLFFYLITPIIIQFDIKKRWMMGFCLFVLLWMLDKLYLEMDGRVILYFPFYTLGLCLGNPQKIRNMYKRNTLLKLLIVLSICLFGILYDNFYLNYIFILSGIYLFSYLSTKLTPIISEKLISYISYSSLVAYLFHRQIYALFNSFNIPLYIAILIIFLISYCIQKCYDLILKFYEK